MPTKQKNTAKPEITDERKVRLDTSVMRILSRMVLIIIGLPLIPFIYFVALAVGEGKEQSLRYWFDRWLQTWKDA